jgi:catechol 2,3-dioxygenase-like lactoylglutathione lyase family enzyme
MAFPSITHVALTVTDLDRSRQWYRRLFDADPVLDEDTGPFHHVAWAVEGGQLVAIHKFPGTSKDRFDEHRVGMDHLSFGVPTRSDLEKWGTRLDELGIKWSPIVDAHYGSGLSFRDPDNNALEFFAPPA